MRFKLVANGGDVSLEVDGEPVNLSLVTGITLRIDAQTMTPELFIAYQGMAIEAEGEGEVVAT